MRNDGHMNRRSPIKILLLALVCLPLLSCGRVDRDFSSLELSLSEDPTSLDPAMIVDVSGGSVAAKIFNGLVKYDEEMNVVPDLASNWRVSEDGRSYTFTLRHDVRFHNG